MYNVLIALKETYLFKDEGQEGLGDTRKNICGFFPNTDETPFIIEYLPINRFYAQEDNNNIFEISKREAMFLYEKILNTKEKTSTK